MGVGEEKKTLWVFGAGASAHLGFPWSWGFLRSTLASLTSFFKDPDDTSLDLGRMFRPEDFQKQDGTPISNDNVRTIKTDPVKAFDLINLWTFAEPVDREDQIRLQYLACNKKFTRSTRIHVFRKHKSKDD
jgi:hypothetical protein